MHEIRKDTGTTKEEHCREKNKREQKRENQNGMEEKKKKKINW